MTTYTVTLSQVGMQGAPGVDGAELNFQGAWVEPRGYATDDLVSHNGSTYACILGHTSTTDDEPGVGVNTATYWTIFTEKGDKGDQGDQGIQGVQGVQGETGPGFTGGTYNPGTGAVTFTSEDGIGFTTDDIRGDQGDKGWSPVFVIASDGARRVFQVDDWVGGEGTKPAVGDYVGPTGLVADIANAVDIRGPKGEIGDTGLTGDTGATGDQGDKGWSPILVIASDGARRVLQVDDWAGGAGAKPAVGDYVGAAGLVTDVANAVDVRGPIGATGDQGIQGIQGIQGETGATGATGDKGWSPILVIASDGARRVLQVDDWTGGEGTKPATGDYIGPTGLVSVIGSAVDIRGPEGAAGDGAGDMLASTYDPQSIAGDAFARANHTGTQALSTISDAGTAAALDVAATGDAAVGEVVKGDDTRLTDARTPTTHTHTKSDITDFSDADYATAAQGGLADTAIQPADIGTAAPLDVAMSGDASVTEVVTGNDSRLSDNRSPTAHTHTLSEITDAGTAAASDASDFATAAQGSSADTALQPGDAVDQTSATGSAAIPAGTEAERDGTPSAGYLRFNSDAGSFEGYDGSEWGAIGGAGGSSVALDGPISAYVGQEKAYTITDYSAFADYSVAAASGTATISGDTITYTAPASDGTDTLTVTRDGVGVAFSITVLPAGVDTPTHVAPSDGATDQGGSVTLQSSAFSWSGLSDTHASADWQVATDSGFSNIVASATADASNLTSFEVTGLSESQTYYWRVRHTGASNGTSDWSTATTFTTAASFGGLIGVAGAQGFGVGEYPGTLPSGFSNLSGNTDPANANYGNYEYSDGSIMAFVPRFYYRIGDAASPHYATYGANAIDIAGVDTYADEAAANAAGFAMHRAFIDAATVKDGFFIDKYLCSKNAGDDAGKSVQNGVPISLTDSTSYTRSDGMTGCTGILADAVVLSRARGAGFNAASAFMYSALWILALAHGQAATSATNCAWYDSGGTTNYPKGCNDGALGDADDASLSFTTAGDGNADKPLTGSASDLAKTAHNGQDCGVVDLNGAMWEVQLGITAPGSSATDTTQISSGDVYVLQEAQALGDLTGGYGGATDAWGDATHLGTLYDAETGLMPWGSGTGWEYLGSGTNQVLDGATSGQGYQRMAVGLPMATTSYDATGTNLFGLDGQYTYNRANLCPIAGGYWSDASDAGLGARNWVRSRSSGTTLAGFRAAAYGP